MRKTSISNEQSKQDTRKGLVIIITGNGKGKTTAALGLLLRAWGHEMKVAMLQFIKNERANYGEHRAARRIGIEIIPGGAGFIRNNNTRNIDKSKSMAQDLWCLAREKILSGDYDMVVLDELSYPLQFGWLDIEEVMDTLKQRPQKVHVVITGRDVPETLIDFANIVSEVREIKHHFQQGVKAQPGIEF